MKKIFVLLCAVVLFAVACEKEYPPTADVIYNAVTDYDGNSYDAVRIGNQVWMASNLRTTHYANGEAIPEGNTLSLTETYRYKPANKKAKVATYGYLYTQPALMHEAAPSEANPSGVQGVCPNGWHVPSAAEWEQLIDYCAGNPECACSGNGDNIAKALAANHGWHKYREDVCSVGNDLSANNATGFSALPAGYYFGSLDIDYPNCTYFWSATSDFNLDGPQWRYGLSFMSRSVDRINGVTAPFPCSVRCVRD